MKGPGKQQQVQRRITGFALLLIGFVCAFVYFNPLLVDSIFTGAIIHHHKAHTKGEVVRRIRNTREPIAPRLRRRGDGKAVRRPQPRKRSGREDVVDAVLDLLFARWRLLRALLAGLRLSSVRRAKLPRRVVLGAAVCDTTSQDLNGVSSRPIAPSHHHASHLRPRNTHSFRS